MIRNETVAYYDNPDNDYAAKTVGADMSHIYPRFLKYLPKNSSLLDVGCGSGRDSLYFLKNGYAVTSIDSSLKMCEYAKQLLQQPVLHQNFEDIDYQECFNGIWACASLFHVQEQNMCNVIRKLFAALVDGGVLYASWKLGDHERILIHPVQSSYHVICPTKPTFPLLNPIQQTILRALLTSHIMQNVAA